MLDMEFMETDYSVLLDYQEPADDPVNGDANGAQLEKQGRPEENLQPPKPSEDGSRGWTLNYYRQFFDVTTTEVTTRILSSSSPLPSSDFLADIIQGKPDLYGPIWIAVSLAVELGLASDMAHVIQNSTERHWRGSVSTVHKASILIFLYSWCLPTMIWIALEWNPMTESKYKLTELLCVYGYASSNFLPVIALWAIPIPWLRWTSGSVAAFISGILICRCLKKAFSKLDASGYYVLQILLFLVNALIAYSFIFLFFPHRITATFENHAELLINNSAISEQLYEDATTLQKKLNFISNISSFDNFTHLKVIEPNRTQPPAWVP